MWDISERQNLDKMQRLLAARHTCFKLPNFLVFAGLVVSVLFSLSALAQVWWPTCFSPYGGYVALASVSYGLIEAWKLDPFVERRSALCAEIIDTFDRDLFEIDRNEHTKQGATRQIISHSSDAASDGAKKNFKDWYSRELSRLPIQVSALIAQYTTTSYDNALRRSYLAILKALLWIIWATILIVAVVGDLTIQSFLISVMVPFLPILTWCLKNLGKTQNLISDQERAISIMESQWSAVLGQRLSGDNLRDAIRDNQDDLFRRRSSSTLLLPLLYKFLRPKLEGNASRGALEFITEYERSRGRMLNGLQ